MYLTMEKRERGSNFTEYDKELLLDLVTNSYFSIIENKKTDGPTLKEKAKAWEEIALKYNAATTNERRTELSLKTAYTNFKRKLKKQSCGDDNKVTRYRPIAPKPRPDDTNTIRLINLLKQHNPIENRLDSSSNYFITDNADLAEIKMEAEEETDDLLEMQNQEVKSVDIASIINNESKSEECSDSAIQREPFTSESDESCSSKRKRNDPYEHSKKSKRTTVENETQTLTVIKTKEIEVIDSLRIQQEAEKLKQEQEKLKQEVERTKQEIIKTKLLELQLNKANLKI